MTMSSVESKKSKQWFPLESNPQVMNKYIDAMGFPTSQFCFHDVLSTEEWALDMVPRPVLAVVLLFPIKDASEQHKEEENKRIEEQGQIVSDKLFYMRQTIGNACGTIGLLHALGNATEWATPAKGKYLDQFLTATKGMTADEMTKYLEEDDEIEQIHESAAQEGQSEQIETVDDPINTHFICFSVVDDHLYELDGRKNFPVNHGASSSATVLEDSLKVIKQFMDRDPGEMRFTILALASAESDD